MSKQFIDGTGFSIVDRGKGPAVVLLHGFPLDNRMWAAQIQGLSDRYRVIAPDLRGFGQTQSEQAFTIESLADDIHALLTALGAHPCVLGGLSMGGYVALAYVKKYPGDFKGLMLIDTKAEADTPQGKEGRQKMIDLVRASGPLAIAAQMLPKMLAENAVVQRPQLAKELRTIMESCPCLTIEHALLAMRDRPDRTSELASIKIPTQIIVGDTDAITPPEVAKGMHDRIAGSGLSIITGAGHMSPMEQSEQVNRAMAGFLKTVY